MKTLDLKTLVPHMRVMIYGHSGSGKTTLAGSLLKNASMKPCVYASLDKSGSVLRGISGIDAVSLEGADDAFLFLKECTQGRFKDHPYVIVDGLGGFLDTLLVEAAEKDSGAAEKRAKGEFVPPPAEIPFTLYSGVYTVMKNFVTGILALQKTVVCTAWVTTVYPKKKITNAKGGVSYERGEVPSSIHPSLPERIKDNLVGAFDMVFYIQGGETGPVVLIKQAGATTARVRDPKVAENLLALADPKKSQIIRNPDLAEIHKLYLKAQG